MSSPFMTSTSGFPDRFIASSPGPRGREVTSPADAQDVSVRSMKLKVLYTFDDQNKTNCLARWPRALDIRTAYLDETTQIGVIDLKTCIQAIVSASPELVARLGQDYTIYAYDYSEYETPLVGQGMLSWILASSSRTPSVPANESRTVVTGRVCKNIMGLFSGGSQETLEVKLRLVPVPTCLQSEYIESMQKYRDLSKIMPEGFDSQAWTNFIQANPSILSLADQSRSESPNVGFAQREMGIEHVQRLLSEGYTSQNGANQCSSQRRGSGYADGSNGQISVRAGSPATSVQSIATQPAFGHNSGRIDSRVSSRAEQQRAHSRKSSIDIGYASNDEKSEGPAKKRAKVTKAEWPTKGSFGTKVDSLRVAASTAASVRVYQPTAIRPTVNTARSLEEPPRAPTPIPNAGNRNSRPLLPTARSGLGQEPLSMSRVEKYDSPYASFEDNPKLLESSVTSSEDNGSISAVNTPVPASSPPIFRTVSPTPSSPMLPTLPRDFDSGFMSGSMDDLFEDNEDRQLDEVDFEIAAQYSKRMEIEPSQSLKSKAPQAKPAYSEVQAPAEDHSQASIQPQNLTKTTGRMRVLNRTSSTGHFLPPPTAASDPVRPNGGMLQRSQTWSGQQVQVQHAASDAPMGSKDSVALKRPVSRSGSGVKRKKQIQSKLATTIAAGEMPPFCDNCGSIETPTWRKAWTKVHCGSENQVRISKGEGGIIALQILEKNENGATSLFKIFKKSLLPSDAGFTEVLLCNPCGLWLNNKNCSRPRALWKHPGDRPDDNNGRGGRLNKSKPDEAVIRSSKDNSQTAISSSDDSSPQDRADDEADEYRDDEQHLPCIKRSRASSMSGKDFRQGKSKTMTDAEAAVALQRAIKSSPARMAGSKNSPIELDDLTPKPTRRILFPSPGSSSQSTPLSEKDLNAGLGSQENSPRRSRRLQSAIARSNSDKENYPPPNDNDFNDLFHTTATPDYPQMSPSTNNPFKTPTKQSPPVNYSLNTGDFFSSAAKALLNPPTTPKLSSPRHQASVEIMTPFTASINASLNQFLTEANNNNYSPSKFLDHSSLHSLGEATSASHVLESDAFGFERFGGEGGIPSSPPAGWFGVYEDPGERSWDLEGGGGWAKSKMVGEEMEVANGAVKEASKEGV